MNPSPRPASPGPGFSSEAIRSSWPQILDALRADKKMIAAEMLAETEVSGVEGDVVILKPQAGHELAADSIERYRTAIETAASRVLGRDVQVALLGAELPSPRAPAPVAAPIPQAAAPAPAPPAPSRKVERLSVAGAQTERAKALRGKDPALDKAMDALDLELLE